MKRYRQDSLPDEKWAGSSLSACALACVWAFAVGGCVTSGPDVQLRPVSAASVPSGNRLAGTVAVDLSDVGPEEVMLSCPGIDILYRTKTGAAMRDSTLSFARQRFDAAFRQSLQPQAHRNYVLRAKLDKILLYQRVTLGFRSTITKFDVTLTLTLCDGQGEVLKQVTAVGKQECDYPAGGGAYMEAFRTEAEGALRRALEKGFSELASSPEVRRYASAVPASVPGKRPRDRDVPVALGPTRRRIAVVVGISEYRHQGKWRLTNLRYAEKDAKAFGEFLKSPKGGRFDEVQVLANREATTRNIKAALRERLRGVQRDDLVVIFWAGHGTPDPHEPKKLYLITHDTDPAHMASTAYGMDELQADIGRLEAQRVLVIADACHSAGISDPKIGIRGVGDNKIVEGLRGVYVAGNRKKEGGVLRMIFTSCETGETSREHADLGGGHGVFTWFLLQAMNGEADKAKRGGNDDGKVTLGEVIEYTRDQVKRFTGNQQHPDTAGRFDRNLPMGVVK